MKEKAYKRGLTVQQYVSIMRTHRANKIKKEIFFIVSLGFVIALLTVYGGLRIILTIADKL